MIYFVSAAAVVGMLGFMFFQVAYSLRKERVRNQREATRGQLGFTRRDRARLLLRRAFAPTEEVTWQVEVSKQLSGLPAIDPAKK